MENNFLQDKTCKNKRRTTERRRGFTYRITAHGEWSSMIEMGFKKSRESGRTKLNERAKKEMVYREKERGMSGGGGEGAKEREVN